MKRRIISAALSSVMLFSVVGITGCELPSPKKETWVDTVSKKMDEELNADNCTEFYLGGEMYTFPLKVSEFLDNGWEFAKESYGEEDLESYYKCEYNLYDENNNVIIVDVYNITEETLKVSECDVDEVTIDGRSGEAMIHGGIAIGENPYESFEDFESHVDMKSMEFEIEESTSTNKYIHTFENEDGYTISATYSVTSFNTTKGTTVGVHQVKYLCKYFPDYSFIEDIKGTLEGIFMNDPSLMNADYLIDTTPEAYVASWRDPDGFPWLISYMMGFDFVDFSDEQLAKIDELITAIHDKNSYTCIGLDKNKVSMTFSYFDFFDIVDKAYDALLESDVDSSDYNMSEECFFYMCDKYIEILNNTTDYLIFPKFKSYDAINSEESDVWYDILYLELGMADLLEE